MVQQDSLAAVLSDFARTMLTDFRIQAILDHLVERIVHVLPVTGAGVTLINADLAPHYVAASDAAALQFERLQTSLREGPCLTAYQSGVLVAISDLATDVRYPQFASAAVEHGLSAVFTFPLAHGDGRLGALDLYRDSPGELDPQDLADAQVLADVAAAYLLNAQAREQAQQASDEFRDSSLHDALTGLPNRLLLQERLEHAEQRAHRSHSTAAVLFADLDRFKNVNDTFGHAVGDVLLVRVAQRLSALLRPGDTLARVSGDEFVILCEDLANAVDAELLATRITEAFTAPFSLPTAQVHMTASVGVAYAGPGNRITPQLLTDADTAMYQAKSRGGGTHQILDPEAVAKAHAYNNLEQDLRSALGNHEFDLAYQPIVHARDGSYTAVEVLLRWMHPQHGPVPASTAVSLAERNGSITEIGEWVLRECCLVRGQWLAAHPDRPLDLAVNISARQVMRPDFARRVAAELEATGMDPAALVLEVTENIFLDDGDRATRVFNDVRAMGVRVALDDFGTGYSSLGYLRRFPVDIIKIDQSFVADLGREPTALAIVTAAIQLAHGLGMSVTAEGVETAEQRDTLIALGCQTMQGYLFGSPMTAIALRSALPRHTPRAGLSSRTGPEAQTPS